jgi:YHS domain-containing protein
MRIHCDVCRGEIDKDLAIVMSDGEGELLYFCSEACVESAEGLDPDRELARVEPTER